MWQGTGRAQPGHGVAAGSWQVPGARGAGQAPLPLSDCARSCWDSLDPSLEGFLGKS